MSIKTIVIAATACTFLLAGCQDEIQIKSDVGETITVPAQTITKSEFDWDKAGNLHASLTQLANAGPDFCSGDMAWLGMDQACSDQRAMIEKSSRHTQLFEKWSQRKEKSLVTFSYRTIKTDLNGQKQPGPYETVDCPNPALSSADLAELQQTTGFKGPEKTSGLVSDVIKVEICKRNAAAFNT